LGAYKVEETTKEKFVANAIQVEMQCRHFYTLHHASKIANAIVIYRVKHEIVDTDMV
jgi:azurin